MCSVSGGVVTIWAHSQVENWSAFAPDFKELDENVEYEEKEGEFDLEDEDSSVQENKGKETTNSNLTYGNLCASFCCCRFRCFSAAVHSLVNKVLFITLLRLMNLLQRINKY